MFNQRAGKSSRTLSKQKAAKKIQNFFDNPARLANLVALRMGS
jgi:hypothetical protein